MTENNFVKFIENEKYFLAQGELWITISKKSKNPEVQINSGTRFYGSCFLKYEDVTVFRIDPTKRPPEIYLDWRRKSGKTQTERIGLVDKIEEVEDWVEKVNRLYQR